MFLPPFHRRQALYDLNAAQAYLAAHGASTKTCAPIERIAKALDAQPAPKSATDWITLTKPLGSAPSGVLAALAQGLLRLHDYDLIPEPTDIPAQARLTRPKDRVDADLVKLARGHLSVEVCKIVAQADYGYRADEHEAALLHMRDIGFTNIPLKERWLPMEVLELVSHVPRDFGHLPCLAVVMLDAVRNHDAYGASSFRWENQHAHLLALPDHMRDPICAAFRFLYENGDGEDLYFDSWESRLPKDAFFPFFAT